MDYTSTTSMNIQNSNIHNNSNNRRPEMDLMDDFDDYGSTANDSSFDDDPFGNDISKELYKEAMLLDNKSKQQHQLNSSSSSTSTTASVQSPSQFNISPPIYNSNSNDSSPHIRKGRRLYFTESSSSPPPLFHSHSHNNIFVESSISPQSPGSLIDGEEPQFKIPKTTTKQTPTFINHFQSKFQNLYNNNPNHSNSLNQDQSIFSSSLPTSPISWGNHSHNHSQQNQTQPMTPNNSVSSSSLTSSPISTNRPTMMPATEVKRIKPDQRAFFENNSYSQSPSPPPTPSIKRYQTYDRFDKSSFFQFIKDNSNSSSNSCGNRKRSTSMTSTINTSSNVNINPFTEEGKSHMTSCTNQSSNDEINLSSSSNINNNSNNNSNDNELNNNSNSNNNNSNNGNSNSNNENLILNSLFNHTFQQLNLIGVGSFGYVYKCRHRIDGCLYAIKKTKRALRGQKDREIVLREVYGLSAIRDHSHIVRYYNAWEEDSHIFIQMEYCNGGNIYKWLTSSFQPSESILLNLTKQLLLGIVHIHSLGLVHLDIKPENIYLCYSSSSSNLIQNTNFSNEELEEQIQSSRLIFKLGDLGLLNEATENKIYSEGDSRYLSRELLHDDMSALKKSDIFSLGCTLYELARCIPLPKSGEEWNSIRDGELRITSDSFSQDFWNLLRSMIHPDPQIRPSAESLLNNPYINFGHLSIQDIERDIESLKSQLLEKELLLKSKLFKNMKL